MPSARGIDCGIMGRRLRVERQRDVERTALALLALDPYFAAVACYELAAEIESQPEALAAPSSAAYIALKEPLRLLLRDAGALVLHDDHRQLPIRGDRAPGGIDRVAQG